MPDTQVREYPSKSDYDKGARALARDGWRVVSAVQEKRRPGCGRIGCLGLFAWLFPPKPVWVVTYSRD